MRGEDHFGEDPDSVGCGSPPHARGRLAKAGVSTSDIRITPACAGKTTAPAFPTCATGDHPRMRGEDATRDVREELNPGSPPHARGRRQDGLVHDVLERITPACAGKTSSCRRRRHRPADHPRMRGEDWLVRWALAESSGSPPHARGRRASEVSLKGLEGITPACAGKTPSTGGATRTTTDHPRMRGEDPGLRRGEDLEPGSPPHARGRP